jgi:putative transcriptional regulator
MENELILNNRIRMWRAERRISQGELADIVGVSRQTISSIENLQFCPSAKLALLICVALDKNFEEVFYFE